MEKCSFEVRSKLLFLVATEQEIKQLKKGDKIRFISSEDDSTEVIEEIVFDNYTGDFRALDGNRVTINGLHWYFEDVIIVERV